MRRKLGESPFVAETPHDCQAAHFVSVGSIAGYVTVRFGGIISDIRGDDVVLVLTGFQPGQRYLEDIEFLANADGGSLPRASYNSRKQLGRRDCLA